jgi:hypothetical protein
MSGSEFTTTPKLGLYKPEYNADAEQWGFHLNANADLLDAAWISGIVDVTLLGAVGDGVTDDTAAIQAAFNTYAGKATVLIPDTGNPYLTGPLNVPSGTALQLNGALKCRPGSGTLLYIVNGVHNVTIDGYGTIDCDGANQTSGNQAGIYLYQASNVRVSGITIKDSINWNVNIVQSSHVRFDAVSLTGGVNSNQFVGGGIGATDCWIVNSFISGVSNDSGFTFYGGVTDSGMSNCTVTGAFVSSVGVYADTAQPTPCARISITDNIFLNNTQYCIAVFSESTATHADILIANNICCDNGHSSAAPFAAIWLDRCNTVTVTGNLIDTFGTNAAQTYGIFLGPNTANSHVAGNTIVRIGNGGPNAAGIGMNAPNYVLITGNYLANMATAITGYIGLAAVITGNRCDAVISGITPQPDTILDNTVNGRRIMTNLPTSATGLPTDAVWRNGTVLNIV